MYWRLPEKSAKAMVLLVEHVQEAGRAAAVLDVGLAVGIGGGEEDAGLLADEGGEVGRDGRPPAAALLHRGIAVRASPCAPGSP